MATVETYTDAPELGAAVDEYADDFTKRAFGADTVVVSTTLGVPDDDADGDDQLESLRQLAGAAVTSRAGRSGGDPSAVARGAPLKKPRGRANPSRGPKALTKRRHVNEANARRAARDAGGRGRGGSGGRGDGGRRGR